MLVRDWMTRNVISLGVNSSILDAAEILREKNIRQFPVIDSEGRLVGIVSDRDVRDAMPSKFVPGDGAVDLKSGLYTLTAGDVMTLDPIVVASDTAMDLVAELIVKHKIGGIPVVDGGTLSGIITQADVMRFLCTATGCHRGGIQFAVRLPAKPGPLAELLRDVKNQNLAFSSVFTSADVERPGFRHAYVRVSDIGDQRVDKVVEALQAKYDLMYYVYEGVTVDLSDS
ncbi:CBS and ACT domain-containing protein [Pseudodesulfovibrio tunisiensis]|uniref:CBS and ACT domain-containing protein n=1 Tax=Pseudodesulfovibrio tunisiensis TaxID=463192 RepID=UPI001FB3B3D0|nr:CBS and ACT domain-containing protein [Pseudodesulfovibrio tunisiensis]